MRSWGAALQGPLALGLSQPLLTFLHSPGTLPGWPLIPSAAFHPSEQATLEGRGDTGVTLPTPQKAGATGVTTGALATLTLESIKAGKVNVLRRLRASLETWA